MERNYESNNGFMTTIWGPMLWSFLHMVSMNYPVNPTKDDIEHYYTFFTSIQHILPCGPCRRNAQSNLATFPLVREIHMASRLALSRWVFDFHNIVNKMIGKTFELDFDEMRDRMELFRAKCSRKQTPGIEKGCTVPAGKQTTVKTKCVLAIVPATRNTGSSSLYVDEECFDNPSEGVHSEQIGRAHV